MKGLIRSQTSTPMTLFQLSWTSDARMRVMTFVAIMLALVGGSQGWLLITSTNST